MAFFFLAPLPQSFNQTITSTPLTPNKIPLGSPGSVKTTGTWLALGIVLFIIATSNGTPLYSVTGVGGNFSVGFGDGNLVVWAIAVFPTIIHINGTAWAPLIGTGLP